MFLNFYFRYQPNAAAYVSISIIFFTKVNVMRACSYLYFCWQIQIFLITLHIKIVKQHSRIIIEVTIKVRFSDISHRTNFNPILIRRAYHYSSGNLK